MPQDRDSRSRVLRLEALKSLLAQRDYTTAAELATELAVSVRTLNRDLATLRDMGLPIDSDRGRGGGLRLEQGWSLGRVHLNETEAIAVLLALTIADKVGSPLLLGDVRVLARKIGSAFAPAQSRRILALRHRILVGEPASPAVLNSFGAADPVWAQALLRAFLQSEVAEITYRDQHGTETTRAIEPHYLYYTFRSGTSWPGTGSATTCGSSVSTESSGSDRWAPRSGDAGPRSHRGRRTGGTDDLTASTKTAAEPA